MFRASVSPKSNFPALLKVALPKKMQTHIHVWCSVAWQPSPSQRAPTPQCGLWVSGKMLLLVVVAAVGVVVGVAVLVVLILEVLALVLVFVEAVAAVVVLVRRSTNSSTMNITSSIRYGVRHRDHTIGLGGVDTQHWKIRINMNYNN